MKHIFTKTLTIAAASALLLQSPRLLAQDDAPPPPPPAAEAGGPGGGPGGPGGPGGADRMAQFRERMNERIKTQLKATDDEWAVIQPLLQKVQDKMRETMTSRFAGPGGMMGGRGGQRRGGDNNNGGGDNKPAGEARPERAGGQGGPGGPGGERRGGGRGAGSPEAQALNETIEGNGNNGEIKTKLQAVRDQRKKAEAELTATREDLKKVLNLRQEAVLVLMGVLD